MYDYIINLKDRIYSYREWQSNGYPCGHALAVILGHQEDVQLYAKTFYTLDPYRSCYIHAIIHPDNDNFVQPLQFIGNNVNSANGDEIGDITGSEDESDDPLRLLVQNFNLEGQKSEGFDIVQKMKGSRVGFKSVVYVVKLDIPKGLAQNLLASLSFM